MTRALKQDDQIIDANGLPIVGAKKYFYQSGTTIPQNVFSSPDLSVPLAQPIIADINGRFIDAFLLESTPYRVTVKSPNDVTIYQRDNVTPLPNMENFISVDDLQSGRGVYAVTGGAGGAYTLTVENSITFYQEGMNFRFRANHTAPYFTDLSQGATININGIGAVPLIWEGKVLLNGHIRIGEIYTVTYNGAGFVMSGVSEPLPQPLFYDLFGSTTAGNPVFAVKTGTYTPSGALTYVLLGMEWTSLGGATGELRLKLWKNQAKTIPLNVRNITRGYAILQTYYGGMNLTQDNLLGVMVPQGNRNEIVLYSSTTSGSSNELTNVTATETALLHVTGLMNTE